MQDIHYKLTDLLVEYLKSHKTSDTLLNTLKFNKYYKYTEKFVAWEEIHLHIIYTDADDGVCKNRLQLVYELSNNTDWSHDKRHGWLNNNQLFTHTLENAYSCNTNYNLYKLHNIPSHVEGEKLDLINAYSYLLSRNDVFTYLFETAEDNITEESMPSLTWQDIEDNNDW